MYNQISKQAIGKIKCNINTICYCNSPINKYSSNRKSSKSFSTVSASAALKSTPTTLNNNSNSNSNSNNNNNSNNTSPSISYSNNNNNNNNSITSTPTTTTTTTSSISTLNNSSCKTCNTLHKKESNPLPIPIETPKPKPVVSFYKRNLPSHLIEFSSDEGKKLFREALANGHMEGYFSLAEQFVSQSDPAFCGLATLAMVLNALKIDPNRLWKGPWRWFAEDMLDCCIPIESVKKRGITFTEFSCLSKCNGAIIKSYRGDESDINEFRNNIIEASSKQGSHLVMSYSRKTLGQTGSGHYSPIGGYHKERDLALVLDVARFKYAPHWVPVETLWESMKVLDNETNKPRGYYILSKNHLYEPSFCRIKNTLSWSSVADKFLNSFPSLLESHHPKDFKDVVEILFKHLPTETPYVLCAYSHELHKSLMKGDKDHDILYNGNGGSGTSSSGLNNSSTITNIDNSNNSLNKWDLFFEEITNNSKSYQVLNELIQESRVDWRVTHQHNHHGSTKEICHDYPVQLATFLFLAFPAHIFNSLSIDIREKLAEIRNLDGLNIKVIKEIMKVREEMFLVNQNPCECTINGISLNGTCNKQNNNNNNNK